MLNKIVAVCLSVALFTTITPALADDVSSNSCKVVVSVSSPPVQFGETVSFNITSRTSNNSALVEAGAPSQTIDNLVCSKEDSYIISATNAKLKTTTMVDNNHPVGQCILKAGPITLGLPGNSLSVVFPNDFICNQTTTN